MLREYLCTLLLLCDPAESSIEKRLGKLGLARKKMDTSKQTKSQVNCGGHMAPDCVSCSTLNFKIPKKSFCNGECEWVETAKGGSCTAADKAAAWLPPPAKEGELRPYHGAGFHTFAFADALACNKTSADEWRSVFYNSTGHFQRDNVPKSQLSPYDKMLTKHSGQWSQRAKLAIADFVSICKSVGIRVWLMAGTLLGWFRSCSVTEYTTDLDFGIDRADLNNDTIPMLRRVMAAHSWGGDFRLGVEGLGNPGYECRFLYNVAGAPRGTPKIQIDLFVLAADGEFYYNGYWHGGDKAQGFSHRCYQTNTGKQRASIEIDANHSVVTWVPGDVTRTISEKYGNWWLPHGRKGPAQHHTYNTEMALCRPTSVTRGCDASDVCDGPGWEAKNAVSLGSLVDFVERVSSNSGLAYALEAPATLLKGKVWPSSMKVYFSKHFQQGNPMSTALQWEHELQNSLHLSTFEIRKKHSKGGTTGFNLVFSAINPATLEFVERNILPPTTPCNLVPLLRRPYKPIRKWRNASCVRL